MHGLSLALKVKMVQRSPKYRPKSIWPYSDLSTPLGLGSPSLGQAQNRPYIHSGRQHPWRQHKCTGGDSKYGEREADKREIESFEEASIALNRVYENVQCSLPNIYACADNRVLINFTSPFVSPRPSTQLLLRQWDEALLPFASILYTRILRTSLEHSQGNTSNSQFDLDFIRNQFMFCHQHCSKLQDR